MPLTLAFDVYGTLINTQGIVSELRTVVGERASAFSQTWREKQLEYSFRRGLMREYQTFAVCTYQALEYTCALYEIDLAQEQKNHLLESYQSLPVFEDVESGLKKL